MANDIRKFLGRFAFVGIASALMVGGTWADKPDWAGGGKQKEGKERHEEKKGDRRDRDEGRRDAQEAFAFGSDHRRIVVEYYDTQARKGHCPPGLAKKNNGCLPPGQEKKWHRGQPLAKDVLYHELPKELRVRLPAPPPNHRYVQVAGDILMIAVGSSMVVDAIEDILR